MVVGTVRWHFTFTANEIHVNKDYAEYPHGSQQRPPTTVGVLAALRRPLLLFVQPSRQGLTGGSTHREEAR